MALTVTLHTPQGDLYIPRKTQRLFHASAAPARCILGGMGAGKSLAGMMEGLIQSLEIKQNAHLGKGLIARSTWEKLHSATWPMFLKIIPPEIRRQCQERLSPYPQVIFPNGFEVRGMNLDDPEKFGSEEYSWMMIDECGEKGVAEEHFLWMVGRRRNKVGRRNILLAGHPRGRNWVWKYFFAHKEDPTKKPIRADGLLLCEGFQVSAEEARSHFDPSYMAMMRATYPPEWIEKYLEGDFGLAEGQILSLDPDIHIVRAFPVPSLWPRYLGVDHGLTHPTCAIWAAADFEGNLIVYREHAQRNLTPAENVKLILAAQKGEPEPDWCVIDPATEARETAGGVIQSIIQQYRDAGLYCSPGDHSLPASITLLQHLMRRDPSRKFPAWHHYKGLPGSPRLFLTTSCPGLKWEMEQWCYMDLKPGQVDRERVRAIDDDRIAALRYLVMRRPKEAVPVVPRTAGERIEEILAELAEERRQDGYTEYIGSERL